ncbi:MAG: LysR family transcriptional regulator [Opitutales bacterium]
MDLPRIRYFLEVARQKNFSRAAEVCFISQPSLSQQIKKLEEEVGGALFLRSRSKVSLSPLGASFLKHAQAIMSEVATAEEFVAETKNETGRTLRFGAIPTIAPYLIPGIFQAIRKAYPKARLELVEKQTDPLIESLRLGEIDFALLSPPLPVDLDLDSLLLAEDELLLTLPAGHPLCAQDPIDIAAIQEAKIILLEGSHCLSQQTAAFCEEVGLRADVEIRGAQIDTLLCLVEAGFGLTLTPRIAARANSHRRLVFRSLRPMPCHRELVIYWLPRQVMSGFMRHAIDLFEHSISSR